MRPPPPSRHSNAHLVLTTSWTATRLLSTYGCPRLRVRSERRSRRMSPRNKPSIPSVRTSASDAIDPLLFFINQYLASGGAAFGQGITSVVEVCGGGLPDRASNGHL